MTTGSPKKQLLLAADLLENSIDSQLNQLREIKLSNRKTQCQTDPGQSANEASHEKSIQVVRLNSSPGLKPAVSKPLPSKSEILDTPISLADEGLIKSDAEPAKDLGAGKSESSDLKIPPVNENEQVQLQKK